MGRRISTHMYAAGRQELKGMICSSNIFGWDQKWSQVMKLGYFHSDARTLASGSPFTWDISGS